MAKKFNFQGIIKKYDDAKIKIAKKAADETVSFFKRSFDKSGFQSGINFDRWAPRKNKKNTKQLLVKSGRLRRSITLKQLSFDKSVISSDLPYANIHNEGGTINIPEKTKVIHFRDHSTNISTRNVTKRFTKANAKGRKKATTAMKVNIGAHEIKIPKRRFIGRSRTLDLRITTMIKQELGKLFR